MRTIMMGLVLAAAMVSDGVRTGMAFTDTPGI